MPALGARENVTLLPRTTAFGYYNHNHIGLVQRLTDHLPQPHPDLPRERLWQVRAGEVVLATGAHERPLVFAGNDRPGIMLAESLRAYVNRYGVAPGRRVVIATSGASAYTAAADLKAAGLEVTPSSICARRPTARRRPRPCARAGCEVLTGHTVLGSRGRRRVTGLIVAPVGASGAIGARARWPATASACPAAGRRRCTCSRSRAGKLRFDAAIDAFVPGDVRAGRALGRRRQRHLSSCSQCLEEGWAAGAAAARRRERARFTASASRTGFRPVRIMPGCDGRRRGRAFVDLQNDVTAKDIGLAVREGFESIEHVKRYTTTGMATDQGKTSNMNALGLVAEALDKPVPEVGTTTFRPPYTPVTFGALRRAEPRQAVRSRAHHADARLGRRPRCRVRGRRPVEARPLLPSGRRGHARRRGPRMHGRARAASASSTPPRSARSRSSARTRPSS